MKKTTYLAATGDANDYKTWGGIPFFLLREAKKIGAIDVGLNLNIEGFRIKFLRYLWNAWTLLRYMEKGGFQYSDFFLSTLWSSSAKKIKGGRIINCFQLYPLKIINDESLELWFYIDQTLLQLYKDYKVEDIIGKKILISSLERERLGYKKSKKIIVHSNWCLDSLVQDYGIDRAKIVVITPGANLYEDVYQTWFDNQKIDSSRGSEVLKLVFVGKHPERKGLDRLIYAFRIARENGAMINLRILGCNRNDVDIAPSIHDKDIDWIGMVDKNKNPEQYFSLVGECDIGCLLSRAEAGGISLREFHALGLAVIYSAVGGSPEHAAPDASIEIDTDMKNIDIAKILERLSGDRVLVNKLKSKSREIRNTMLNSYTANLIANEIEK